MTNKKKGFTLVEILVVILIIGLLFVFLVPKIDSATDKARETGIKTDFRSYQTAFEAVAREQGGLGHQAMGTASKNTATVIEKVNYYLDPALQIAAPNTTIAGTTNKTPAAVTTTVEQSTTGNSGAAASYASDGDHREAATGETCIAYTQTKLDPWNNNYIVNYRDASGVNKNNGMIQIYTKGKDSKAGTMLPEYTPIAAFGSGATGVDWWTQGEGHLNVDRPGAGKEGHDDYSLTTIYVDGVIYSSTTGFSTDIKPIG